MAGFPTTGGWRLLHSKTGGVDLYPATDAPVVARMRAAGAVILGKTNIPVLSATGSHANDSWAGPPITQPGASSCPGDRAPERRRRSGRVWRCWALPRRQAGRSRTRLPRKGWSASSRPSRSCRMSACCRFRVCATWLGPIGRCVRDAALALDALAGFTMADPKTVAGIGHKPPGGYAADLKPDALRGKRIGTYGPGMAQPAALGGSDSALSARAGRDRSARRHSCRGPIRRLRLRGLTDADRAGRGI